MLAAVARKDYEDRRRRQAEGIHRAKSNGLYRGRAEDTAKQERVAKLLDNGLSWREIIETIGCSRGLVAKVAKQNKGRS